MTAAQTGGAGLIILLCVFGLAGCFVWALRDMMGVRQRHDITHKRWWER